MSLKVWAIKFNGVKITGLERRCEIWIKSAVIRLAKGRFKLHLGKLGNKCILHACMGKEKKRKEKKTQGSACQVAAVSNQTDALICLFFFSWIPGQVFEVKHVDPCPAAQQPPEMDRYLIDVDYISLLLLYVSLKLSISSWDEESCPASPEDGIKVDPASARHRGERRQGRHKGRARSGFQVQRPLSPPEADHCHLQ